MRAARLLRLLILLQNRGRMNARQLADELEVHRRTILRDVDAMTEAGLPIIVHQGAQGGIELGFNYRTRLTGLNREEAMALGIALRSLPKGLRDLGLEPAARRAADKLVESFPDRVREVIEEATMRFAIEDEHRDLPDPRISAVCQAMNEDKRIILRARSVLPQAVVPERLARVDGVWRLFGQGATPDGEPLTEWGDINISARLREHG